ncbi:hypothetical protein LRH25_31375 [Ideonella azotifigens]|uniref:5-bromo-4-chloroindolyl phosphate hydrolase n=1 Tax=Ideonella azotifigens TaxID=513160 RepID=A0ABN1K0I2_9BURK|nr:hypothetical protein [Ideonella azotifigens]MCD2344826.1 hypothetical protein [Ideonella azotifigens]
MPERTLKLRLLLWLYSSANIAGCALALLGPALLFAGLIGHGWLLITVGLYAAGWLLGRRPPALERHIEDSLTVAQTLDRLDAVIAQASPHLNDEMRQHLARVRESAAEVLPRLVGAQTHGDELFTVRETVLRYLPETLANYAALPPAFRLNHPLKDGKTARELLAEQLDLLDSQLREIVANVASHDAAALVANGQFLAARFRQADFLAG